MESTVSVSKGVFLFSNGFRKTKLPKKKPKRHIFENLSKELWYKTFKSNWGSIENELKELHEKTYSVLLNDIVSYIHSMSQEHDYSALEGIIPSATLLTGVNQPDHVNQFLALIGKIKSEVTPHVAMINSQDASTLKHFVESAVWQLIHGSDALDNFMEDSFENDIKQNTIYKKNQCTMKTLLNWYQSRYLKLSPKKQKYDVSKKGLVIIIPDFESFNCNILQDFVMIVSSYVKILPILLIFGVATSVSALHKSFPYHVSSKLLIKVFHSHPSHVYMNQVLEKIFLNHTSPFHLSGRAFELLTDVFLFYDFSVTGLIQSIKYCMIDHYYGDNIKSLCCSRDRLEDAVNNLTKYDLENIRQLLSFRPFLEVQDCETKIGLFEDNNFFREVLLKEMNKLHDYLHSFYLCIRILSVFVKDLPKNIFGKTIRELYAKCSSESISRSQSFKECMQLLKFQSQMILVESIKNALKELNLVLQPVSPIKPLRSTPSKNNIPNVTLKNDLGHDFAKSVRIHLMTFLRQLENASNEATVFANTDMDVENELDDDNVPGNRYKLKEKLLRATRVEKVQSEYEMIRSRFVSYLEEVFEKGLQPPHTQTFHEILFFTDVANVKKQIVGSPRGALHTALSNPMYYLQYVIGDLRLQRSCLEVEETLKCRRLAWIGQAVGALLLGAQEIQSKTFHNEDILLWWLAIPPYLTVLDGKCTCCQLPSLDSISDTLPDVSIAYKLHRECGKHINLYDWLQAFAAILRPDEDDEERYQDINIQVRFTRAVSELQFLGFIKSSKRKTDHVMRLTW